MLRMKISKLKQVCTPNFVPRIFRGDFYSLVPLSDQKRPLHCTTTSSSHNDDNECERCQQIIEKAFSPNLPFTETLFTECDPKTEVVTQIVSFKSPDKENNCEICRRLIKYIFGDECQTEKQINNINKRHKTLQVENLKATTSGIDEEQLAQKIEVIDETPIVEAHKPVIEGFNVQPKVLGSRDNVKTTESLYFATDKNIYKDSAGSVKKDETRFDEIAKRCLNSPNDQIDEYLLKEMEKIGISVISEQNSKKNINENDIFQAEIMKKPKKPSAKTDLDLFVVMDQKDFRHISSNDLGYMAATGIVGDDTVKPNRGCSDKQTYKPDAKEIKEDDDISVTTEESFSKLAHFEASVGKQDRNLAEKTLQDIRNQDIIQKLLRTRLEHLIPDKMKSIDFINDFTDNKHFEKSVTPTLKDAVVTSQEIIDKSRTQDLILESTNSAETGNNDNLKGKDETSYESDQLQDIYSECFKSERVIPNHILYKTNIEADERTTLPHPGVIIREYIEFSTNSTLTEGANGPMRKASKIKDQMLYEVHIKGGTREDDHTRYEMKEEPTVYKSNISRKYEEYLQNAQKPINNSDIYSRHHSTVSPKESNATKSECTECDRQDAEHSKCIIKDRKQADINQEAQLDEKYESQAQQRPFINQGVQFPAQQRPSDEKSGLIIPQSRQQQTLKSAIQTTQSMHIENVGYMANVDQDSIRSSDPSNRKILDKSIDRVIVAETGRIPNLILNMKNDTVSEKEDESIKITESRPLLHKLDRPPTSNESEKHNENKITNTSILSSILEMHSSSAKVDKCKENKTEGDGREICEKFEGPLIDKTVLTSVAPQSIQQQSPNATIEPASLPNEAMTLKQLLNRVRERNRLEYCRDVKLQMYSAAQVDPAEGKCGTKPPTCPPPAPTCPPIKPKCPPPVPTCPPPAPTRPPCPPPPKSPCPPPQPPCPNPCKPKCPPPCTPNPCAPKPPCPPVKKSPCDKFKCKYNPIEIEDSLPILILNVPKFTETSGTSNDAINNDVLSTLQKYSKSFLFPINLEKEKSSEMIYDVNYARTYHPWSPIPSWPIPKKEDKKQLVCPKHGCKEAPPRLNSPSRDANPCINFPIPKPNSLTNKRSFSIFNFLYYFNI